MKLLILTALLISVIGCVDKVTTETIAPTLDIAPICPEPEKLPLVISELTFDGVQEVTNIKQNSITVKWNHVPGFSSYHIMQKVDGEYEVLKTVNAPKKKVLLKKLDADSNYTILVRAFDKKGKIDLNTNEITVTTLSSPIYNNQKSISFNGSQGISLAASKSYSRRNKITINTWFKTGHTPVSDSHLITLHHGATADTALALNALNDKLQLKYKDELGVVKRQNLSIIDYNDNNWHHITVSFNRAEFVVYFDGKKVDTITDTFIGLGDFPASVGSYTGLQKGFVGQIDEVSLFNTSLSLRNIKDIYNNQDTTNLLMHKRKKSLVSWYQMGDQSTDSPAIINDVAGPNNATPLNITNADFVNEGP